MAIEHAPDPIKRALCLPFETIKPVTPLELLDFGHRGTVFYSYLYYIHLNVVRFIDLVRFSLGGGSRGGGGLNGAIRNEQLQLF